MGEDKGEVALALAVGRAAPVAEEALAGADPGVALPPACVGMCHPVEEYIGYT